MQPKAAKKIGGMTPKKMTGGQDTEEVLEFDGTKYTIRKTQEKDELKICVSAPMPGAEVKKNEVKGEGEGEEVTGSLVAPAAKQPAAKQPAAEQSGEFNMNAAKERAGFGGKKKRKSSKKRKSMKKGGMRKSMKVKA